MDQGEVNEKAEEGERDLIFLGLAGIRDPPREEVVQAIKDLRSAGTIFSHIEKKITARNSHVHDHWRSSSNCSCNCKTLTNHRFQWQRYFQPEKIIFILRNKDEEEEIGMDNKLVIDGPAIDNLDRGALAKLDPFPRVFARVNPNHKDKVVDALHIRGEVTAMIGDGVNDATALQHADVGVSMGKSGTDLAQQAAAIILMDDNVGTLVSAIKVCFFSLFSHFNFSYNFLIFF